MKVYDTINKIELEADTKKSVDIMVDGRQVDLHLSEKKTDAFQRVAADETLVVDGRPMLYIP